MNPEDDHTADTTAAVMRQTAEVLEESEAALHRSAEESPNRAKTERMHDLADAVTAEAKRIAKRAKHVTDQESPAALP
jgi:ElaB/YqjD/DUF883 family membrane-anchored ribosome-binding protein